MNEGGQSPLLCIKINNVRNTKALNGTDGALVCVVNVEGVDYHPIDVVLRRPKSDHGLQKNSLVFQLPGIVSRFEVAFKKKYHKDESVQPTVVVARANIQLQYSSMPFTSLPRRSSYNSLSPNTGSPTASPRHSPQQPLHLYNSMGGSPAGSPTSAPISIQGSGAPASNTSPSPLSMSGSSPININTPPQYSLSGSPASNTPNEYGLSGSPSMMTYNGNSIHQKSPTPIRGSNSVSSPSLATPAPNENEEYRIDSSLKWYKLYVLGVGNSNSIVSSSNNNNNPLSNSSNGQQPHLHHTISHSSFNTGYSESESTYSNDEVEVQLQISYENTNLPGLVRLKSLHRDLLDVVVTPKLQLVHASCDAVDITAAAAMAKSLVDIFHCHHKLLHLLKAFMKKEVAACHDPGTLFRSNSVAMKMVVAYGHKTAQHYVAQTLTPLVVELCSSPLSLEVDPDRLQPDEDVNENIEKLKVVSQKFFDRIVQSIDQCPKSIIEICYYFKKIVSRKFPNHWRAAVGGFIFLRLFCPACVSPENAGIISPGRVGISERRALVLVAKCLQNLSNQVTFNQPYMESLNDFIKSNAPLLDDFFVRLAARPSEDQTIDGMIVSEDSFHDGIVYVQQFLDKNQERVFKNLEAAGFPELIKPEKLQEVIDLSKKAMLQSSPLLLLSKNRSNSAGSSNSPKIEVKKNRSNSDNKEPSFKWQSTLSKNLKIAKQNVITPTLNVISNNFPTAKEEEVLINLDFVWKENPRPAHVVVQHLLRMIVSICKNNKLTDQQILRSNPKNSLTRTRQIRGGDVRRQFVIPLDPRYHFALCNVNITLPCLRIFSPDTINEDLHKSGEEFCSSKIDICTKKKEISLPKLFSQFGTDFGKNRGEMLKWLFQFLTSAKRTELIDILEKPSYLCVYRGESWNPITYKTKFIDFDDVEEKEASEKKMSEREKVLRRKSRSLTHGIDQADRHRFESSGEANL
ncbi:Ras GTPase activation domain-containing protein [Heterostelium album PN500]|uniref:Ras GTPase activation domain-containing protein n=1 Tax=Heterostelium pallidum (strain ATCC 26659 / Pp 5 / PN500) TaxID=670386 RepID=D3BPT7_HETP5|nr:Ras GTPase activation domain-containing protein [Heterostelium album PN500]EFA76220.1 Ras GTPase activation domain-containing protein [Heterostelium album PN500]|eukprot:XP_020428353.1 Ras GTPase activation domain-containing protein [Heterostelium album PN500]